MLYCNRSVGVHSIFTTLHIRHTITRIAKDIWVRILRRLNGIIKLLKGQCYHPVTKAARDAKAPATPLPRTGQLTKYPHLVIEPTL